MCKVLRLTVKDRDFQIKVSLFFNTIFFDLYKVFPSVPLVSILLLGSASPKDWENIHLNFFIGSA